MVYMGSKNRIAKYILPFINEALERRKPDYYIEPFMGGCNMLDKVNYPRRIGSDYNKYLVALFEGLVQGRRIKKQFTKAEYTQFKKNLDQYDDFTIGWYGIFFSFSGKFLDSYGGKELEPSGRIINRGKRNIKNALRQLPKLKSVKFNACNYTDYLNYTNCVFYLDPPYAGTGKYKEGEAGFDSGAFWDFVRELSKQNDVFISEYTAPSDFKIVWEMNKGLCGVSVAINSGVNKHNERLFKYG